jgi:nicotinamide riboside kinase
MKIALTGPQGTGKTTLLNALAERTEFQHYEFAREITRAIADKGVAINEAGSNKTQLLIMNAHIENTLKENIIMDRCVIDGFVYTQWLYKNGMIDKWVRDYAMNVFEEILEDYDYVFYIGTEFALEDDGVRSINRTFLAEVEDLFEEVLDWYSIEYCKLTGTVEERLEQILNTIYE